jgi:hypothetical protein
MPTPLSPSLPAPPLPVRTRLPDVAARLASGPAGSPKHAQRQPVTTPATVSPPAQYVTIPLAAALTGYSAKAIRRKIESGVWLEGREYRKAPDGHVLISMKGYQQWVERGRV